MWDISSYLIEDPYSIPDDEVAVPDAHNPPDLIETLEIVNKARALLSPGEISKLNNTTGE